MGIYRPEPKLSKRDKRLLQLIAQLLLQHSDPDSISGNIPMGAVPLSDSEAEELADLIDSLVSNRRFLEVSYFVEGITAQDDRNESALKEIYLSARKNRGRSRAMASTHWAQFRSRLGTDKYAVRRIRPEMMSFGRFLEMERRLLSSLGVHPRVVNLLLKVIEFHEGEIEELRDSSAAIPHGTFKKIISSMTETVGARDMQSVYDNLVSHTDLSAVATFIANSSVMFTTRDWGVAGTISCMAGALIGMRRQD